MNIAEINDKYTDFYPEIRVMIKKFIKFYRKKFTVDDFIGNSYELFISAINKFDESRGIPFKVYYFTLLKIKIMRFNENTLLPEYYHSGYINNLRNKYSKSQLENAIKGKMSLNCKYNDESSDTYLDKMSFDYEINNSFNYRELKEFLNKLMYNFKPKTRIIMEEKIFKDKSFEMIGETLGCSKQNIAEIYRRSIKTLRKEVSQFI